MNNSIKEFKIKLSQKNIINIEGNVNDFFIIKNENKMETLHNIIYKEVFEMGYSEISHFTPGKPKIKVLKDDYDRGDYDPDNINQNDDDNISFDNFVEDAFKEINDSNKDRKVYIIDFAAIKLDSASAEIPVNQISALLASVLNKNFNIRESTIAIKSSKVIFISRDSGNLWKLLTNRNIENANIFISKPDLDERKKFFECFHNRFRVKDCEKLAIETKEQNIAIALTDKFSFKEIFQIAKISNEKKFSRLTFKELFFLAQFNKKDSEWEKIDSKSLLTLEEKLNERVFGQDFAIKAVKSTLMRSKLGFSGYLENENKNKPKGVLFFGGPTGVGKTELAKAIAEFIFKDESKLLRFDMSEYSHEHSDQRLIGSPPGYVGYDAGGELTNKVKENPFSILLFDEIEKANKKLFDKFLQILEDGRLTSSKGELIDFSETFIIFTSNIGYDQTSFKNKEIDNRTIFKKAIESHFKDEIKRPEILNRIGTKNIIPFNYIKDKKIINGISKSKINKFEKLLLQKYNIKFIYDHFEDLLNVIYKEVDFSMGGRGIVSCIETHLIDKLSSFMFKNPNTQEKKEEIMFIKLNITKHDEIDFEIIKNQV